MRRLIEKEIKRPLVDRILFGDLKEGGTVAVKAPASSDGDDGLVLEVEGLG